MEYLRYHAPASSPSHATLPCSRLNSSCWALQWDRLVPPLRVAVVPESKAYRRRHPATGYLKRRGHHYGHGVSVMTLIMPLRRTGRAMVMVVSRYTATLMIPLGHTAGPIVMVVSRCTATVNLPAQAQYSNIVRVNPRCSNKLRLEMGFVAQV